MGKKDKCFSSKKSLVKQERDKWLKKGIELVNITTLCETKMGGSGWCNDFNEPEETCHHIQIWYRDEVIANVHADGIEIIDEDRFLLFISEDCMGDDFIIFRKVKTMKNWIKLLFRNRLCPKCKKELEFWGGERVICRNCGYEERFGKWN